ncbi:MAG: kynureninase [Anaerolineales bacterium]
MKSLPNLDVITALDASDPQRSVRERFVIPEGVIYLDGNSLGPAPKAALAELEKAAREEWAVGLIRSWNTADWYTLTARLGDQIGRLIGAAPGETVVSDATSINLYKALHAGLSLRPERKVIVAEASSFPTDLYVAEGVASTCPGVTIRLEGVDAPTIEELIDERVAVVLVNHVDYRSGALRDMAALTAKAHEAGAVILWDLCHSAGALPVDLNAAGADLAVGCTYKYLNGGPGSPAFVFAAQRHHDRLQQPLSGWWGHASPFSFERGFRPDAGMRRMLSGTQPVLSLRALEGALGVWADVDLAQLRDKSLALSDLFIQLVEAHCGQHGTVLASPRDRAARGSQVSFAHDDAYAVMQALIERGVIGDFRAPNLMRFGFTPLYARYRDVWDAAMALSDILTTGTWRADRFAVRTAVT